MVRVIIVEKIVKLKLIMGILPTKEMVINQVEAIILIYLSLKKP
jgi:hypothetical protein